MKRYYTNIATNKDLKEATELARKQNLTAVGFTKSGKSYVYDFENESAKEISHEEAADILCVELADIDKIIATRCKVVFDDEAPNLNDLVDEHIEALEEIKEEVRSNPTPVVGEVPSDEEDDEDDYEEDDEDEEEYEEEDYEELTLEEVQACHDSLDENNKLLATLIEVEKENGTKLDELNTLLKKNILE